MALNVGLLIMADRLAVHYALAVLISAGLLIPLSFLLHLTWTYRVNGAATNFARYCGTQIVNTPIALFLFFILIDGLGLAMHRVAPIVTALMFLYNFLSSYWAIALSQPRASS